MCGISSEIAWQLFFPILDPFWPTFGHFTGSGRYGLYRGAGPKRLSKNLKFYQKPSKTKKIELTIKMCGISSEIAWQPLFFILGPFWPTFGHFTNSGRYSLCRGAGPKDSKIWNLTKKHQKRKKLNLPSKFAQFHRESRDIFFSILDPFWPTFDHFTSSVQ